MKVALGVTGCIAAYKAIEVMRGLQKAGIEVEAVLTRSACKFVPPLTFEALSGKPVVAEMFEPGSNAQIQHIRIAQEIRLLAVVPATANIIGKFARGIADDFLSTLYLSCSVPVLLAPAMNVEMWNHPAVQANLEILRARKHLVVDPEAGELACGTQGMGKLAAVETIVGHILDLLGSRGSLSGVKVLVTAGPTVEDLDPVRFLSNRSSGKMGYAVAQAARLRGAEVHLVTGPTDLTVPAGVDATQVRSAAEMLDAVLRFYPDVDVVVKAAAVADYRPTEFAPGKIKKRRKPTLLTLTPTEDILSILGRTKAHQILVGFAAETEALMANAKKKLAAKKLDMIVANDVAQGVFGSDRATVSIVSPAGETVHLEKQSKKAIADAILDRVEALITARRSPAAPVRLPE